MNKLACQPNRLNELIQELCPNLPACLPAGGVEWVKLGDVCEFRNGFAFKSNLFKEIGCPILRITNIADGYIDLSDVKYFDNKDYKEDLEKYEVVKNDILVAMSGATTGKIGFYSNDNKAYLNQRVGKFLPNKEKLCNRFLYHFLLSKVDYIYQLAGGGAQPNLSSVKMMQTQIPLPPLAVQEEIVRILDNFTELTAEITEELTKEFTARKKQYEYYRDSLLTFDLPAGKAGDVEWKMVSLVEIISLTKNIKWKETQKSYRYIDLTSVDKETNSILETSIISAKNAPSRAQKIVEKDDVIFATTRPTQMRICLIDEYYSGEIASTGYCVLRANKKQVLPKWIFYNLSKTIFKNFLEENQSGSAYPSISDSKLKDFKIPLPPLAEQERIVTILDKFDTLTNSITNGLPKEIELRQKQYEYYRDKLLSF